MKIPILLFLLANLVLFAIIFNYPGENRVVFLDVGQGSSVLIQNGKNVFLYDAGRSGYKVLQGLKKYLPFFHKRIDILFISHSDKDHYQAGFDLLERYKIRYLVSSKNFSESGFQQLIQKAVNKGTKILFLDRKDEILTRDLKISVLHPARDFSGKDNDVSLVLKIAGKNNSFLLTGDIEKKAIKAIIDCCQELLKSKVFLWPHHGSKHSLDLDFLKKISPEIAIIQVGFNPYGHPHKEVLQLLNSLKIPIIRTDLMGSIPFPL